MLLHVSLSDFAFLLKKRGDFTRDISTWGQVQIPATLSIFEATTTLDDDDTRAVANHQHAYSLSLIMEVVVNVHGGQTTTSKAQTHLDINTISKQKPTTHEQKPTSPTLHPASKKLLWQTCQSQQQLQNNHSPFSTTTNRLGLRVQVQLFQPVFILSDSSFLLCFGSVGLAHVSHLLYHLSIALIT